MEQKVKTDTYTKQLCIPRELRPKNSQSPS